MTSAEDKLGGYSGSKTADEMGPPAQRESPPGLMTVRASVDVDVGDRGWVHLEVEAPHRIVERAIASVADSVTEEVER